MSFWLKVYLITRYQGLSWLVYRIWNEILERTGYYSWRMPRESWSSSTLEPYLSDSELGDPKRYFAYRLETGPQIFFPAYSECIATQLALYDLEKPALSVLNSEALLRGEFSFFSFHKRNPGYPPCWHESPFGGTCYENSKHWSRIDDFATGDIKGVWELNRFSFVYDLVRAYHRTGDESFPEAFWELVENWRDENQPNSGVNWKCGQEIAFRVMAWCFGLYGFLNCRATTAARVASLAQMFAVSAERINRHYSYALSQNNNHSISEAVGLLTVGALFPEFKQASDWEKKGRRYLELLAEKLIYKDGTFSQLSLNYHRVMLHDYAWALRLGETVERPLSSMVYERVRGAMEFLKDIVEPTTGEAPCFGQNDGALVLPLTNCDYVDFRPVVQSVSYLCGQGLCYEVGAWDEELFWLSGDGFLKRQVKLERERIISNEGGFYTLKGQNSMAFVRGARFKHRPSQADVFHTDLWWHGRELAIDAGTYSYNAPDPWNNSLSSSFCHNMVTVDEREQMHRVSRFLWVPWLHGKSNSRKISVTNGRAGNLANDGEITCWEGTHNGYQGARSPVRYGRAVLLMPGEIWLVVDRLLSSGKHDYRLHWLFADREHQWDQAGGIVFGPDKLSCHFQVATSGDLQTPSLVVKSADSNRGWRSRYYLDKEPALSFCLNAKSDHIVFGSCFSPEPVKINVTLNEVIVETSRRRFRVGLLGKGSPEGVASVTMESPLT
jgi:hypothetical protein